MSGKLITALCLLVLASLGAGCAAPDLEGAVEAEESAQERNEAERSGRRALEELDRH